MRISFIGAGNVATNMAINLHNSGNEIVEVYARTPGSGRKICRQTGAREVDLLAKLSSQVELFIAAIPDDQYASLLAEYPIPATPIVHTSGSLALDVLKVRTPVSGVFYPLQTFTVDVDKSFRDVPMCIEASEPDFQSVLMALAATISNRVYAVNSEQRKTLHLAAVFANNFSNRMYGIAEELLEQEGLSFEILKPLIRETAEKILTGSPEQVQTGPAARNDKKVIQNHLKILHSKSAYREIYKLITASILATRGNNEPRQ